jgi:cell division protease FtsH
MKNEIKHNADTVRIQERNKVLEGARRVLKAEFIGLDPIIDGIVDTIRSWFLVPEMQNRPLIINLWGMTGVGKTALVCRLAEKLGFSESKHFLRSPIPESPMQGHLGRSPPGISEAKTEEPFAAS